MIGFLYTHERSVILLAKATQEQIAKITEWQKENVKQFTIRFNKKTDADILEHLQRINDAKIKTQTYIKALIRKDME